MPSSIAAVVLAGGAGRRLGGADKPGLVVAGSTLLDRALAALGEDTTPIVVVGPHRPTARSVCWTREDPPGSGPVAALVAGLAEVGNAETVAVLAADLVGLRPDTVDRLAGRLVASDADGVVLQDGDGRTQWLVGVWRTRALRVALPADPGGRSLHSTLGALHVLELPERDGESRDIDVPADVPADIPADLPGRSDRHQAGGR